ncbi:ATP-dependent endonuclease [Pseudonocardia sp. EC080610-09]|uniref:ATP-dependent nuclease n=1 Tax=Pseudonocardia sp. EC080610-09 TaxID=1688404 RepID=UPI000760E047|nr:ATP-binding protein [Pseudonocardia sp. EC080610-09]
MPRVRRVEIERFRGIRALEWVVPADQRFVALIGAGDGCKTTILTAVARALSDSWSVAFRDTDFYAGEFDKPIIIRVAVGDLDAELLDREVAGLHLCGITTDGALVHDPGEGDEACVVAELRVEDDLEPRWSFYRPGETGDPTAMRASVRARLRAFRIDDRVDAHLRWSRTSALGRLTAAQHGARGVLLAAQRAASRAASDHVGDELRHLTTTVQEHILKQGNGNFQALRPGLDTSLTNAHGNLALHEGEIPLTSFGLGTRRLVGAAIQQLAHPGQAILLVDELEHGLEPHRVAHLAGQLRGPGSFAQVVVTSHSPVVLQHLDAGDLSIVRRGEDGAVEVRRLDIDLQGVLRANPAAFLSRHVLICEGKTEFGIAMAQTARWDAQRRQSSSALPAAAALGVCIVDGSGSEAADRAGLLRDAGYIVTYFLDGDRSDTNQQASALAERGVQVVRWADGHCTERAICDALTPTGLATYIDLAITALSNEGEKTPDEARQTIRDHLRLRLPDDITDPLDPTTWVQHGVTLEDARIATATASSKEGKGWFKRIESGKRLGGLLSSDPELLAAEQLQTVLRTLHDYLYPAVDTDITPEAILGTAVGSADEASSL